MRSLRADFRTWPSRLAVSLVAVLAATLATYANSLANGFAYDDVYIIAGDPRVHTLHHQATLWLTPYWFMKGGGQLGLYRPLTIFGFALQWVLGGGAPWVFHLVSVLLAAAVAVLVLLLLRRLAGPDAALFGAVLFAVHPLHTEVVANVVGQAELIAAAGVLGACVLWLGRPAGLRVPPGRLAAVAALYALALLAKEGAIVLPALLLVLDLAQGRITFTRRELEHAARRLAPAFVALGAVAAAYLLLRVHVLGAVAGADAGPWFPFLRGPHRVLTALRAWPEYARLLFFPLDLSADYSPAVILPVTALSPMVLLGGFLLIATVALAALTPRQPRLGLPAAWFLVAVLPVSNLFFPIGVILAERTLFLPSVAVAAVAAFAWEALAAAPAPRTRPLRALLLLVLTLCAARSIVRNPDWASTKALFAGLLRDHPESYRAQWSAASRAAAAGDSVAATRHWDLAFMLYPDDGEFLTEFGMFEVGRARYGRAMALLQRADSVQPGNPGTALVRGLALLKTGRFEQALARFDQSERLGGPTPGLLDLRAEALRDLGRHAEEAATLGRALALPDGDGWKRWFMLGRAYTSLRDGAAARAALDSARARSPRDSASADRIRRAEAEIRWP